MIPFLSYSNRWATAKDISDITVSVSETEMKSKEEHASKIFQYLSIPRAKGIRHKAYATHCAFHRDCLPKHETAESPDSWDRARSNQNLEKLKLLKSED